MSVSRTEGRHPILQMRILGAPLFPEQWVILDGDVLMHSLSAVQEKVVSRHSRILLSQNKFQAHGVTSTAPSSLISSLLQLNSTQINLRGTISCHLVLVLNASSASEGGYFLTLHKPSLFAKVCFKCPTMDPYIPLPPFLCSLLILKIWKLASSVRSSLLRFVMWSVYIHLSQSITIDLRVRTGCPMDPFHSVNRVVFFVIGVCCEKQRLNRPKLLKLNLERDSSRSHSQPVVEWRFDLGSGQIPSPTCFLVVLQAKTC